MAFFPIADIYTYLYICKLGREPLSYRVKAVESLSVGKLTGSRLSIGVPMILIYKQSGWTWPARKITDRKDMFFSIVETAVSSIFYGVMATCAVMAILYLILKSVDRSIVKSLAFYLTGIVLAILLFIQFSLMSGAYQAKGAADSAINYLNQLSEEHDGALGINDIKQGLDSVLEEYPILGTFVDITNYSEQELSDLTETIHKTLSDHINTYIWHRVLWIIGFVIVGCTITVLLNRSYTSGNQGDYSGLSGTSGLQF